MSRWTGRTRALRWNGRKSSSHRVLRAEALEPRLALSAAAALQDTAGAPHAVGAAAKGAATVTLRPVADAAVKATTPIANLGRAGNLLVANNSSALASNDAETFLKFNLSGINAPIAKAVLKLTPRAVGKAVSSLTLGVELLDDLDDGWVEGKGGTNAKMTGPITWFNSPFSLGQQLRIAGSRLKPWKTISIDVTSLINQDINANRTASFELKAVSRFGPRQWVDFVSREGAKAGLRPVLVITKGVTLQPPPTVDEQPTASDLTGTGVQLSVLGASSSGEPNLAYTWSVVSPAGAVPPTFSDNGANTSKNTAVAFHQAGTYAFTATITDRISGRSVRSNPVTVTVDASLTSLQVTPAAVSLGLLGTQQFAAEGLDQFGRAIAGSLGEVTWSVDGNGTIDSSSGLYAAPSTASVDTVTAKSGLLSDTATVTVTANSLGLKDAALGSLVDTLGIDGSIDREDMLAIFRSPDATTDGIVTSIDLADLKAILSRATTLNIPTYVQVLAGDVIDGNTANALYQDTVLGNLAAGSTASHLDKLVSKWFLGADHPATGGYSYSTVSGGLFPANGPSHLDERQGGVGDCYLISPLGVIADSSQAAIRNMFIDNGVDGITGAHTWTVRFYAGGVADYVTVDDELPTDGSGRLVFQGDGSTAANPKGLWIALVEKAYAQWNETGRAGRDGQNSYASLEAGWMDDVCAQVLGYDAASYDLVTASDQQALTSAVTGNKAVTVGTISSDRGDGGLPFGLVGNHAYGVIGYNSTAKTFTLYNPWGISQPTKALSWAELKTVCDGFVVADTSGTQPIAAGAHSSSVRPVIAPRPVGLPEAHLGPVASVADALDDSDARQDAARAADAVFAGETTVQSPWVRSDSLRAWSGRHRTAAGLSALPHGNFGRIPDELAASAIDCVLQDV